MRSNATTDFVLPMKWSHYVRGFGIDMGYQLKQYVTPADHGCRCLLWSILYNSYVRFFQFSNGIHQAWMVAALQMWWARQNNDANIQQNWQRRFICLLCSLALMFHKANSATVKPAGNHNKALGNEDFHTDQRHWSFRLYCISRVRHPRIVSLRPSVFRTGFLSWSAYEPNWWLHAYASFTFSSNSVVGERHFPHLNFRSSWDAQPNFLLHWVTYELIVFLSVFVISLVGLHVVNDQLELADNFYTEVAGAYHQNHQRPT